MPEIKQLSYAVPNSQREGESAIYRNLANKDSLEFKALPHIQTVYDIFWNSVKNSPNSPYIGERVYDPVTNKHGAYKFQTYAETGKRVTNLASGIIYIYKKAHGITGDAPRNWPVAIYSTNRPEWNITEKAAITQSLQGVSLYDTLGESSIEYIMNHSESPLLFCSLDKVSKLLSITDKIPKLRTIVSMDSFGLENEGIGLPSPFNVNSIKLLREWAASKNIELYSFDEVEQIGVKNPIPHCPPKPDDYYTILYTSGTTGNPKGALTKHKGYTTSAKAVNMTGGIKPGAVYLSFLPLAHCYDRNIENSVTLAAGSIGYFSGDITKVVEDSQALQPTVMCGVPRLLNRIYDRLAAASIHAPGLKGMLARKAVAAKLENMRAGNGNLHWFWDRIIFKKMQAALSSRMEFIVTGSAPLDAKVMDFLRISLCCTIIEGYGMTETAGIATTQNLDDFSSGCIGVPTAGAEIKLVDIPDMNYFATDKPCPRGELCVRADYVFSEYLKEPEKTAETFLEGGWLATGDVARINPDGTFAIIDRKKNMFKLSQGEYVAPEKIENVITRSPAFMQAFVYGDSFQNYLVSIVVPDPEGFIPWAQSVIGDRAKSMDLNALCKDPAIIKAALGEISNVTAAAKLAGFERPRAVHLETNMFSAENGILTPTMKLKRNEAKIYFKEQIDALYASLK
ncbi:Fatty acyl-CoA synthetase A [Zancudomyces culisetae]|uniref:Fatty acyl-CoA synthetase A n=1 Tax=Zancudomyces culisetae TaxID=1213189 RepID=A0A1R1PXW7_ZANCU|nr:Fatty acyl-CoA synthetase A [Zancudomyces culisetae]|eukprot:OMH85779.1 Fatty acyl-CoA synthetase A [Zancudomyces culisetae]